MLYDPKWEKQTKTDIYTLGSMIAWLEKQPARTEYCYADSRTCLIAQYLEDHGVADSNLLSSQIAERFGPWAVYVAVHEPMNFGGALERARRLASRS
jgi:hypothetical protein